MTTLDYLIIGAGPAGLQLAYDMEKADCNYLVLEKSANAGSFFERYPRHRKLISINKVHTGTNDPEMKMRWDWNSLICDDPTLRLEKYTKEYFPNADYLVQYLKDFAEEYKLKITYNSEVVNIDKVDGVFVVKTADDKVYYAKTVVVGTGIFKAFNPKIEGIELCENYTDVSIDTEEFNNKRVLVIGKGNSGFETADHLVGAASVIHVVSPNSINLAWQTHFVGHLRAVNNNFLDTYQLKSQNAILDAKVAKVEKKDGKYNVTFEYAHANGEVEVISYDRVLVATGFRFDNSIFSPATMPELAIDDRFPKQTSEWESTNVKGLHFIGAITQQRDFKKYTSAFIHGFRYNVVCLFHLMRLKYQSVPLPSKVLDFKVESFSDELKRRINQSSSLWQQFGFLCDLLTVNPETMESRYYETLSTDFVHESNKWKDEHQFFLTLEYGKFDKSDNVFALERVPEADKAKDSKFLHPIIRHYYKGEMVSEHHMIEDLETDWTNEVMHIQPMNEYLKAAFADIQKMQMPMQEKMM